MRPTTKKDLGFQPPCASRRNETTTKKEEDNLDLFRLCLLPVLQDTSTYFLRCHARGCLPPCFLLEKPNWRDRESTGALIPDFAFQRKFSLPPSPDLLFPPPLLHFSDLNNGNEPSNHLPHRISVKFPRFKKAHDALYPSPPPYARRARAPLCRILKSGDEFKKEGGGDKNWEWVGSCEGSFRKEMGIEKRGS